MLLTTLGVIYYIEIQYFGGTNKKEKKLDEKHKMENYF